MYQVDGQTEGNSPPRKHFFFCCASRAVSFHTKQRDVSHHLQRVALHLFYRLCYQHGAAIFFCDISLASKPRGNSPFCPIEYPLYGRGRVDGAGGRSGARRYRCRHRSFHPFDNYFRPTLTFIERKDLTLYSSSRVSPHLFEGVRHCTLAACDRAF